MNLFNSVSEPWAKIIALLATIGFGICFYFLIAPLWGIGVALGAIIYFFFHWGARLDERPFWQHIFGRSVVYPESKEKKDQDA